MMLDFEENTTIDLKADNYKLSAQNKQLQFINENLKNLVRYYQKQLFGSSKDQLLPKEMFNEVELESNQEEQEEDNSESSNVGGYTRKKAKRRPLPAHLPRKEIIHDLKPEEKVCACCSSELQKIGEETSEKLDIIPAQIIVEKHIRYKYACKACEGNIKKAELPVQLFPKSNATPGLLAHIIIAKYQDALPLYRQESIFARLDIDLSRSVMASWIIKIAGMLQPLINLMKEDIILGPIINCDETRVRVLKKDGAKVEGNSFMWVMGSWMPERNIIIFEYDATRSSAVPLRLLSEFTGYLQVDGYDGYNAATQQYNIKRVGCFAHVKRKFTDCINSADKKYRKNHSAHKALEFIRRLYKVEHDLKDLSIEEKTIKRQEKSIPILDEFRTWLTQERLEIPPKTAYGKALAYAYNEWAYLIRYVEHGALTPDNNKAENAIRPFVIGRKNWLFSDTEKGANASAILYSIIETAKANGLEPYFYLRNMLEKLPLAKTIQDYEALLPYKINS